MMFPSEATLRASHISIAYNQCMAKKMRLSDRLRDAVRNAEVTRYRIAQDTIDLLAEYLELEVVRRPKRRR